MACRCARCGTIYDDWIYWSFNINNIKYKEIVHISENGNWDLDHLFKKYPAYVSEIKEGFRTCADDRCNLMSIYVCIRDYRKEITRRRSWERLRIKEVKTKNKYYHLRNKYTQPKRMYENKDRGKVLDRQQNLDDVVLSKDNGRYREGTWWGDNSWMLTRRLQRHSPFMF